MSKRPVDKQQAISAFYAKRAADVSFYPALWHTLNVGHLMSTDLERICRAYGLSFADVHLLAAARVEGLKTQRATDLAALLNVSDAALSTRIRRLQQKGLLTRTFSVDDRRAAEVALTPEGEAISDLLSAEIAEHSNFVRCFHRLAVQDQQALARIMGELHNELDREFISSSRGKI